MDRKNQSIDWPLKSLAGALLFSVFLGPVGLLYATSFGGFMMIVVGFVVVSSKYVVPMILTWVLSCVWSVVATNRYNKKVIEKTITLTKA